MEDIIQDQRNGLENQAVQIAELNKEMHNKDIENQAAHGRYLDRVGRLVVEVAELEEKLKDSEAAIIAFKYSKADAIREMADTMEDSHIRNWILAYIDNLKGEAE